MLQNGGNSITKTAHGPTGGKPKPAGRQTQPLMMAYYGAGHAEVDNEQRTPISFGIWKPWSGGNRNEPAQQVLS